MPLPDSFIQDLIARNDIEAVVSSYVRLKRTGQNLVGLCPFHGEKTPSFTVFPSTASFYCFGCGATGDAIDFVARLFQISNKDAAEKIAADFGLQYDSHIPYVLPKRTATAVQIQKQRERYTYDVLVRYHRQLQEWLVMCAPDSPESDIDPRYVEAIHQKDYVEYLMVYFLTGSLEERTSLCSERNPNIRRIAHRLAQLTNENKTLSMESISR